MKSLFYKYYESQYDLLKEMENELLSQVEAVIAEDESADVLRDNYLEVIFPAPSGS